VSTALCFMKSLSFAAEAGDSKCSEWIEFVNEDAMSLTFYPAPIQTDM